MGKRRRRFVQNTESKPDEEVVNPRHIIVKVINPHDEPVTQHYGGHNYHYLPGVIKQDITKEQYYEHIAKLQQEGWRIGSKIRTRWNKFAKIVAIQTYEKASERYIIPTKIEVFILQLEGSATPMGTLGYAAEELELIEAPALYQVK